MRGTFAADQREDHDTLHSDCDVLGSLPGFFYYFYFRGVS